MLGARQDSFEVARIVAAAAAVVGAVFCGSFAEEARYLDAQIQMGFAMAKYYDRVVSQIRYEKCEVRRRHIFTPTWLSHL